MVEPQRPLVIFTRISPTAANPGDIHQNIPNCSVPSQHALEQLHSVRETLRRRRRQPRTKFPIPNS